MAFHAVEHCARIKHNQHVTSIDTANDVLKIGGKLPLEPGYPLHEK